MSVHAITTSKSPSPLHLLASTLKAQLGSAFLGYIFDLDVQLTELDGFYDRPDGVWEVIPLVHSNGCHPRLQFQYLAAVPD